MMISLQNAIVNYSNYIEIQYCFVILMTVTTLLFYYVISITLIGALNPNFLNLIINREKFSSRNVLVPFLILLC